MRTLFLFDMDGVLLTPMGYHTSLRTSVRRIGLALGAPNTELHHEEIAKFEALGVTNEWDSLAICTAVVLLHLWKFDTTIRLKGLKPCAKRVAENAPDFAAFLASFNNTGDLPGHAAYQQIVADLPWLDDAQRGHLREILHNCRDIYTSPTLPGYQETVLGSETFQQNYGLDPQLHIESYLLKHDQPVMTSEQVTDLLAWLSIPENAASILTNRPCRTPEGYLSSPEAEIGAKLVGFENLPMLGSGMLAWFAVTQRQLPDHTFLKPNPVHALGLMQMILGQRPEAALVKATDLFLGKSPASDWSELDGAKVVIFEDAAKGLKCGMAARDLLLQLGIKINLSLIGVTVNPDKRHALQGLADRIFPDINQIDWNEF